MGQVEEYKEYAPDGTLLPAYQNSTPKSKYPEDVLINNHSTVWGSWYDRESYVVYSHLVKSRRGSWGYKCCHQVHKHAYCTGDFMVPSKAETVLPVITKTEDIKQEKEASNSASGSESEEDRKRRKRKRDKKDSKHKKRSKKTKKEKRHKKKKKSEEKKKSSDEVTPEQFEEYRRTKERWDDPLAKFEESERKGGY